MERPILPAILSCQGTELTDDEKRLFAKANPLGISLFSRNIQKAEQVRYLIKEIKQTIGRNNVIIAIDEEGGRVSRLKPITKHSYVSAQTLSTVSVAYSKLHAKLIAHDMKRYGINVNYAPVIDKKTATMSMVLDSRCFSSDTKKIVYYGQAVADTYIEEGICPCIKHIPGHFGVTNDPHLNIISSDISLENIQQQIQYLQNFATYPLAMTSHIILNAIDNQAPVTMSAKCVNDLLRGYLGINGILISDAIDMHALKGNIIERAEATWAAGIDIVCYCGGKYADLYNICQLKRFMSENTRIKFANVEKIINNIKKCVDILPSRKLYKDKFKDKLKVNYTYDATEILNKMLKQGENI